MNSIALGIEKINSIVNITIKLKFIFFLLRMCSNFEVGNLYFKHYYYNDYIDLKCNLLSAMNETVK